jgi:threonine dehydrogenase-like Zn-dependent dehydrogenase
VCRIEEHGCKDTVAVIGCGGVGLGAVAASSARGACTICIDVEDEKFELARAARTALTLPPTITRSNEGNDRMPRSL